MAVPKRKISKTRQRKRRTHKKATAPTVNECDKCLQPKIRHRVCPHCGHYAGRQVIDVDEF
ncbi:MAG: 50S ribosomal protein L32 [Gemmatimonadota bacterium]|nr:50S ribosomal protein L32 [Gemmatimonadota bacterium]